MTESVLIDNLKVCYLCGCRKDHMHHCLRGAYRGKADRYGYTVPVCLYCHQEIHGHPNGELDIGLKQIAQNHFESNHGTRMDFIHEFGRNYL